MSFLKSRWGAMAMVGVGACAIALVAGPPEPESRIEKIADLTDKCVSPKQAKTAYRVVYPSEPTVAKVSLAIVHCDGIITTTTPTIGPDFIDVVVNALSVGGIEKTGHSITMDE